MYGELADNYLMKHVLLGRWLWKYLFNFASGINQNVKKCKDKQVIKQNLDQFQRNKLTKKKNLQSSVHFSIQSSS